MLDQTELHENAVQRAEIAAVDPAPHGAVDDGRHSPGDDQTKAQEFPAPGVGLDQLSDAKPKQQI